MGGFLSAAWRVVSEYVDPPQKSIYVFGELDSGKSSILRQFVPGGNAVEVTQIGSKIMNLEFCDVQFTVIKRQLNQRITPDYFIACHAAVLVLRRNRFKQSKFDELVDYLLTASLAKRTLLILITHDGFEEEGEGKDVSRRVEERIKQEMQCIFKFSVVNFKNGEGVYDAFEWLFKQVTGK